LISWISSLFLSSFVDFAVAANLIRIRSDGAMRMARAVVYFGLVTRSSPCIPEWTSQK
jgi:hypothetical protein